jgi:hypothetical protein
LTIPPYYDPGTPVVADRVTTLERYGGARGPETKVDPRKPSRKKLLRVNQVPSTSNEGSSSEVTLTPACIACATGRGGAFSTVPCPPP